MIEKFIKPNPTFEWFLIPCFYIFCFGFLSAHNILIWHITGTEAWVYVPGIRHMADAGPSLLPDAIPEYYSRGHPLLFYF